MVMATSTVCPTAHTEPYPLMSPLAGAENGEVVEVMRYVVHPALRCEGRVILINGRVHPYFIEFFFHALIGPEL